MTITQVLAHATVSDLEVAEDWYSRLFDRKPDLRPMDGLLQWDLSEAFGVQVWAEPDRAGDSCMVLNESDLDAFAAHLDRTGIAHPPIEDATSSRILPLTDPDGNRVVFLGAFA